MHKKYRFGLVGHGHIGKRYVEKIVKNPRTTLVAACDIKPAELDKLQELGVFVTSDYQEIVSHPDVDVVVVAAPNYLHKEITIAGLKHNKHVICEKPMTISVRDASQMVLAADKSDGKLFIVKQNRFNPPVVEVKKLLEDEKLGKIYSVVINCYWNRNPQYYQSSDWKGRAALDGGTLFTQFSHFIDIAYYLFGDFATVYAKGENFGHQELIEFEDTGVVLFTLANGAIGSLNYTTCSYNQNMEGSITVFAEHGTLKIGGQYLNIMEYQQLKGKPIVIQDTGSQANDYGFYKGSMSNHHLLIDNVVKTLDGKAKMATSSFEGMKVVQIIEAIYDSMKQGTEVVVK